jgi:hypothetical protein
VLIISDNDVSRRQLHCPKVCKETDRVLDGSKIAARNGRLTSVVPSQPGNHFCQLHRPGKSHVTVKVHGESGDCLVADNRFDFPSQILRFQAIENCC